MEPRRSTAGPCSCGFTLLEVLVALSIIATAMVALLALHGRNIEIVAYDQNLSRATLLAQEMLVRTMVENPFPDPGETGGDFPDDPRFHWSLRVLPGPTRDLENEIREIRLRVFWDPRDPDAVRLVTHVRKPEGGT